MDSVTSPSIAATAQAPRQFRLLSFSPAQSIAFVLMLAVILLAPTVGYPIFLMKVLCLVLFACSFNLLGGYGGLISFGHAAYFGLGAYITAWVAKNWGVSPEVAILLGGLTAGGVGTLFGWVAIRRPGMFFPMITLAVGQMVYFFCLQAPFTNGEDGIQKVPRGALFGLFPLDNNLVLYWVIAAIFLAGFLLMHRVVHSPFGQVLKSIRDNEPRAISLGYETAHYKLITTMLATTIAGIAGGSKAIVFGIATLADVGFGTSGEALLMTLVGGLGTIFGPVVGATIVASMENFLSPFGAWVTVAQGVIFVVCVLMFRSGLIGELGKKLKISL
ncbi:branched-chain amino acid ABC transporter permease [Glaciimonas sp. GNP009]